MQVCRATAGHWRGNWCSFATVARGTALPSPTRRDAWGLPAGQCLFRTVALFLGGFRDMTFTRAFRIAVAGLTLVSLAACGGGLGSGRGGFLDPGDNVVETSEGVKLQGGQSIFDIFRRSDPDINVAVNRYLWNASLDVLNFLPVESVDPFTGVIVFGYGTPPGGGRSYRATVHIKDPALDARSLVVAMQTRGGPVAAGTRRAVEDSILARARQLRIDDKRF